jgi:replication-associated recombination protein RarA
LFGAPDGGIDESPLDAAQAGASTPLAARMRPRTLDEFVG